MGILKKQENHGMRVFEIRWLYQDPLNCYSIFIHLKMLYNKIKCNCFQWLHDSMWTWVEGK